MKSRLSGKLPRKSKLKEQTKLFISCLTSFVWLFFSFLKFLGNIFFSCAMALSKEDSLKRRDLLFHIILPGKFTSKPRTRVIEPVFLARVQTYPTWAIAWKSSFKTLSLPPQRPFVHSSSLLSG